MGDDASLTGQVSRAERFRALHHSADILLLPNVWDVVSARLYEEEGFAALGTTSAGIAATLGYPDGQRITVDDTARVVEHIVHRVAIPVSADIEAGYGLSPEAVAEAARRVLDAGAVGINMEDRPSGRGIDHDVELLDVDVVEERIRAIRAMAEGAGVPLVINARTDVCLAGSAAGADRLGEVIRRGNRYLAAGADCVFVPDMGDLTRAGIAELLSGLDGPLNLIAGAGTPPVPELQAMGVARLSFGPRPMRAALRLLQEMAREWTREGTYERMLTSAISYEEVNAWFEAAGSGPA